MAESKSKLESARQWVSEHKLRTVGCLWLSAVTGSVAYNWSRPTMKTSVKLIHARWLLWVRRFVNLSWLNKALFDHNALPASLMLHAQALTLAALVGAAAVEYFDHDNPPKKDDPYAKFVPLDSSHKN